jgi:anti-sigma factor RsiW
MPEFVRGELPKNKMNEISSHLNTCNDCCEELEKWDELFTELRSLVNYTHKPELKIDFSSKEKTSLTPWIVGGVGVGMLLAAGGALLWRRK